MYTLYLQRFKAEPLFIKREPSEKNIQFLGCTRNCKLFKQEYTVPLDQNLGRRISNASQETCLTPYSSEIAYLKSFISFF